MKTLKIQLLALLAVMMLFTSCDDLFSDMNKDPNKMESVPPMSMLPSIVYNGSNILINRHHRLSSQLMQYQVQTNGYEAISQYVIKDSDPDYLWTNLYRRYNDAEEMCTIAETYHNSNARAIGLIMKSWLMSNLTDIFGDVPYTEALGAMSGNLQPKFDLQKDIYTQILADLDTANVLLTNPTAMSDTEIGQDLLFKGNLQNWRKFANSLHLRLLLRLSNRADELDVVNDFKRIANDVVNYPVFTSATEGAIVRYSGVEPFLNPFYNRKDTEFNGNYRMCSRLVDLMNNSADKRREKFMTSISGSYYGIASGNDQAYIIEAMDNNGIGVSKLHLSLKGSTFPFAIMNYSELQFILSEAAYLGWISGSAQDYYNKGIKASIDEWSITMTNSAKDMFIDQDMVRFNGTLERILEQKWVSLYFVCFESWYDYTRTGYPTMPQGNSLQNNGVLPTRLRYPAILQSVNATQLQIAIDRMGGNNDMQTPVWWGKRN